MNPILPGRTRVNSNHIKMKFIVEKSDFEKFSDELKKEYIEKEGVFTLNLEGHEEVLIPKAKKDLAEQHRKEAEKRVAEAEAREAKLLKDLEDSNKTAKQVEEIRQNHQKEVEKIKLEYAEREKTNLQAQADLMIKAEADKFASDKFTIPTLVSKAYKERLAVETVDGHQVIRVREEDGKPSVKSLADLQKEFLENPEFAPIVRKSSGSGGGANNPGGPSGGATGKTLKRSEFDAMTPYQQSDLMTGKEVPVLVDD